MGPDADNGFGCADGSEVAMDEQKKCGYRWQTETGYETHICGLQEGHEGDHVCGIWNDLGLCHEKKANVAK